MLQNSQFCAKIVNTTAYSGTEFGAGNASLRPNQSHEGVS